MNGFSYDRFQNPPAKREQNNLNSLKDPIEKKLVFKLLGFINRL